MPLLMTNTFPVLEHLAADGAVLWIANGENVSVQGRYSIRVVCGAFDLYLQRGEQSGKPIFSKAI